MIRITKDDFMIKYLPTPYPNERFYNILDM